MPPWRKRQREGRDGRGGGGERKEKGRDVWGSGRSVGGRKCEENEEDLWL